MKISYVLDSVDNGTVVLPEFQRGYVWTRDQVKGLVQSLYERYPVGGLLIWNTSADTTELRGAGPGGSETVKLLLDGQQRVTSLYGVLRGRPPRFFEDLEKAKAFTGLHFHLDRETFEFYKPSTMSGDPLWISVTDLMLQGPEDLTDLLSEIEGLSNKQFGQYVNRLQRLHGIRDIDLHDENISGDHMTVDVVVDIFNRVNSGGTKLSKGDLALARICALRPAARDELRGAIARWGSAGFEFTLDWFLRCVNVVVTGEAKFEAMKAVSSEDFGVGLKQAEQAVDFILNLLATRLGLDHDRVLMGRYGIPALVRLAVDHGGTITDATLQNDILFWYVHQAAWGRYSGSTETMLDRDLAAIEEAGIDGLIRELELSRGSLLVRPDDFDTQTVGSRFYPVLYMLTRVDDARDLVSGMPLSAHLLGKGSKLEVHHVFPKARLYEAGYAKKSVNAVANFAFLTGDSNRKLGMRTPIDYFAETDASHPGALDSQWITDDRSMWEIESYPRFLAERRRRLATATNAFLNGLRSGQPTADVEGVGSGVEETDDDALSTLSTWCASLGLARPEYPAEIVDPDTGEPLVYADAAWVDGMQIEKSERVALLLDRDEEAEARLGELGFRFFTSERALRMYVEELLNADLDGDGVVGAPAAVGDASAVPAPPRSGGRTDARTWYVNFGDEVSRSWEDARRYGFVSAGGGHWYSKPLQKLRPGDTVLVYLPGAGYAGMGTVIRRAVPFEEAVVEVDGVATRLADVARRARYAHNPVDGEDEREFVVAVSWDVTVDKADAYKEAGLFSNQATTVEMKPSVERHAWTLEAVPARLGGAGAAAADHVRTGAEGQAPPVGAAASEAAFHEAMTGVYEKAKAIGYHPTYFIQMVANDGGLAAAKQLLAADKPSQGFTELWERGRLDLTVEALVLRPEFSSLFSTMELRTARRRLQEFGYEP